MSALRRCRGPLTRPTFDVMRRVSKVYLSHTGQMKELRGKYTANLLEIMANIVREDGGRCSCDRPEGD